MSNEQKDTKKEPEIKAVNLIKGAGINLIPPKTQAEKQIEQTKSALNVNAAFALLALAALTIVIFGFNAISKLQLNSEQESLITLENALAKRADLLSSNDEILRRVNLYEDIKEGTYSSKNIVEYWLEISKDLAVINTIELNRGLIFSVAGGSKSLDDASKLWYLLATDRRIETVNLKSIIKDETGARFTFEGQLNFSEFGLEQ